jgi:hypothetical protein
MARPCTVCQSPRRDEINVALVRQSESSGALCLETKEPTGPAYE